MRVRAVGIGVVVVALMAALGGRLEAATLTFETSLNGTGSASYTNQFGNPYTYMSQSVSLPQFNPALGSLTSAVLEWDFGGSSTVSPPDFAGAWTTGTLSYTFRNSTVAQPYNISTPTAFTFLGPDGNADLLAGGGVTGTGTFAAGTFVATIFVGPQTLYPVGVTGDFSGLVKLTYAYTPPNGGPSVPEPATLMLVGAGLGGVVLRRRVRR